MRSFFPPWIVVTHFLNVFFMLLLARSGLEVLSAFPELYWSDDCTPGREWLRFSTKTASGGGRDQRLPGRSLPAPPPRSALQRGSEAERTLSPR
jgi:hypothetical protein